MNLSGTTASGRIRVNFKCVGDKVVAASVAVPPTSREPDEMEVQIIRTAVVLRFMQNLVPEHDWSIPEKNFVAEAIGRLSRAPEKTWSRMIGDKFIFVNWAVHPSLISIGVIPREFRNKPYDIGGF